MKKIQLTQKGEFLLPYPSDKEKSDCELNFCIGVHEFCEGWIDIHQIAKTYNVLHCRRCNFRLLIPIEVDTWKKLKKELVTLKKK